MANPEHLEILKRSVKEWNQWRETHPNVRPDLILKKALSIFSRQT